MDLPTQAARRRTFAIISHPDAGKTTLTEKFLLYAGAIHLAGAVKSRKASRHALSDWMKMEQERGISITSSVLQFDYQGKAFNLLDTPGHADFSEDTYRTLAAVDAVVMLMDHAKGVEDRTLKLFEVCRRRNLPIITFMNKLDRQGRHPLDLLDDVSRTLQLRVAPLTWPVGMGRDFCGVMDVRTHDVTLFQAAQHGSERAHQRGMTLEEAVCVFQNHPSNPWVQIQEELDLVAQAGDSYERQAFLEGRLTPLFWGSAMTNFGVEMLLEFIAQHAPGPLPRTTVDHRQVEAVSPGFSGLVFKIQANMNPRHRDRMAFMRVVSGHFERGMEVIIGRTGERLKLTKPHSFLAQERSIVDEAWPGDIVGLYDPGHLRMGDTLAQDQALCFDGIPRFAPEHFIQLVLMNPLKRKALDKGLEQLTHEGVVQMFLYPKTRCSRPPHEPYLGAVGLLQFEVLMERLKNEYQVPVRLQSLPYRLARWVGGDPQALAWLQDRQDYTLVEDRNGHPVVLSESPWLLQYALTHAPGLALHDVEPLASTST